VHALSDGASLDDKLLGEREIGPAFVKERLPSDGELIPSRLNRRRSPPCCQEQQKVILGLAEWVTFRRRNSMYHLRRENTNAVCSLTMSALGRRSPSGESVSASSTPPSMPCSKRFIMQSRCVSGTSSAPTNALWRWK
jgi:hypothetical protein